jgi:hypothetical protein
MSEEKSQQHLDYDRYIQWRNSLHEIYGQSWEGLSKNLLFLSSGALALSLTFFDSIGKTSPDRILEKVILVKVSWFAFTITIIFTLLSFGTTILASYQTIQKWDEAHDKDTEMDYRSCANIMTIFLSSVAGASFLVGVLMFVVFAVLNV